MAVVWPQYEERISFESFFDVPEKSYACNNGVTCYCIDGAIYVTPSTRKVEEALAGFSHKLFYVPFSNGDLPSREFERTKWEYLIRMRKAEMMSDFRIECINYSNTLGIGSLNEDILEEKCIELPETGVHVKHVYFETDYFPFFAGAYFDIVHPRSMLGTFYANNGIIVFITNDGRTMVTPCYSMLPMLKAAGFRERAMFVPLSNGEVIQEPRLWAKWKSIK